MSGDAVERRAGGGRMVDVALVTGAGRGMGLACARRMIARALVVVADIDGDAAARAARDLERMGGRALPVAGDVADPGDIRRMLDSATAAGRLVAVAHAAGVSPTMAAWRRVMEVDLCGSARLVAAALPVLAPGGAVVCFASIAGHLITPPAEAVALLDAPLEPDLLARLEPYLAGDRAEGTAYGWAKHGVIRLCQRMAAAFGERGLRIASVSPGLILDTPQGEQELAQQPAMRAMLELTPLGRGGRAEDIAAVVEWLCFSPDAAFVTGADLRVDGGVTAALQHGTTIVSAHAAS
jgi:NAD(P)-dependent dehydrogenase (short-subunit alcohol dehydrogenase family)